MDHMSILRDNWLKLGDILGLDWRHVKASIDYLVWVDDLKGNLKKAQALDQANDNVKGIPDITVGYILETDSGKLYHNFRILGPDAETVEDALKQFFDIAGPPDHIDDNYNLAKRVLGNYKKGLKRITGYVVDI